MDVWGQVRQRKDCGCWSGNRQSIGVRGEVLLSVKTMRVAAE
jgi:hypothetical protein